jgi:quercetin 2,3-dioxygenase
MAVTIRRSESIHQANGTIQNGTFHGRWHFSFDDYYDPGFTNFGMLRVFNDDTLSPGAVWPLHPHRDIEVVTYAVEGEFRHADEHGEGGILREGWVQHTTVGRGMWHSEINNQADAPMRFIQMWFQPWTKGLEPFLEQKRVEKSQRMNRFLPLVSNVHSEALNISSNAQVYSSFLQMHKEIHHRPKAGWGAYLYVLKGGPIHVDDEIVTSLGAAMIQDDDEINVTAAGDAELLLIDVEI